MIDAIRDMVNELDIEANTMLAPVVAAALTNAFYSALIYESGESGPGEDAARRAMRGVKGVYEALVDAVEEQSGEAVLF